LRLFACNFSYRKKYYTAKAQGGRRIKKRAHALFLLFILLSRVNSLHRADFLTSTTINACFRVNVIFGISFRNGVNRAFGLTGTACDAIVVNDTRHYGHLPFFTLV